MGWVDGGWGAERGLSLSWFHIHVPELITVDSFVAHKYTKLVSPWKGLLRHQWINSYNDETEKVSNNISPKTKKKKKREKERKKERKKEKRKKERETEKHEFIPVGEQ